MGNHIRRRRQLTGQYWDKVGNRYHVALDMSMDDPYWAWICSSAIIDAAEHIEPHIWIMFRIEYQTEVPFTRQLGREFDVLDDPDEHLIVRTRSERGNSIDSWFFVHCSTTDKAIDINDALGKYFRKIGAETKHEIISARRLRRELTNLFDVRTFPPKLAGKRVARWSTSRHIGRILREHRIRSLVEMARNRNWDPHIINMPDGTSFERHMALFLIGDRPIVNRTTRKVKIDILDKFAEEGLITDDEMVNIVKVYVGLKANKKVCEVIY